MKTFTLFGGLITALFSVVQADENLVLDDLLINASTVPVSALQVGSSVTVITAAQIEAMGAQHLVDALRQVPGLSVNRAGGFGGLSQVRVRGSEGNHVLVLVDGVEIAPADTGEIDLSSLGVRDVERIEVLRGPQSGLYGSNALAGVIAITTHAPDEGFGGSLQTEAGSFETTHVSASFTGGSELLNSAVTVSRRSEKGLNAARFGSEEDDNELTALTARGRVATGPDSALSLALRWVEKNTETDPQDFSGGPLQGLIVDGSDTSDTRDLNLALGLDLTAGNWQHRADLSYVDTRLNGNGGFGGYGSDTSRSRLAWQSTVLLAPATSSYVTGFAELESETYQNRYPADVSQQPQLDRDLAAVGIEYRTSLGSALYVAASTRLDFNDAFDDAATARLTAAWLLNREQTRLHASVGRGVTNPTFYEQFGFTPGFFVGNPNLQPETSVGWDIGLEHRWGESAMVTDVTVFDANLENEIVAAFPSVSNAAGRSKRQGLEASLQARWDERWDLSLSYTFTDSQQPDGQSELRVPRHVGALDVGYAMANDRTRLHLGVRHNGSRVDADFRNFFANGFVAGRARLDSYSLVNFGVRHQVSRRLQVYLQADNVLDERYEELLSYNVPGRAFYLGMRFALGD